MSATWSTVVALGKYDCKGSPPLPSHLRTRTRTVALCR